MYKNPYDRNEGLGPEDHIKFKKLMKPYSKYKKYIFTLSESDVKAILNHKYDLKTNKEKMKATLHQNETRKCKEMVKRYSVKMHQRHLQKYKSTRRALQKCKTFLNKTKKGGGSLARMRRTRKSRRRRRRKHKRDKHKRDKQRRLQKERAAQQEQEALQAQMENKSSWNDDSARSRLYDELSYELYNRPFNRLEPEYQQFILKEYQQQ